MNQPTPRFLAPNVALKNAYDHKNSCLPRILPFQPGVIFRLTMTAGKQNTPSDPLLASQTLDPVQRKTSRRSSLSEINSVHRRITSLPHQDHDTASGNKTATSKSHRISPIFSPKLYAFWSNGWLTEALNCTLSLVALVCLILVLRHFDGHVLTDVPLGISINTLIAVFAAVVKSSLLLPVAEGG